MTSEQQQLKPASELARRSNRYPNESERYRRARTAVLAEEIELRRHIERVAAQRRALPPGGEVLEDYRFEGEQGPVRLSEMFCDKSGHARCAPRCWGALDGEMPDILQRVAFAVIACSPIERLTAFKKERGWRHLRLYSSAGNDFNRAYAHEKACSGEDNAAFNVFTRANGAVRHFWGDEMGVESADPGQDPRGAPDPMPIWTILDMTPEERGVDWYPKLNYDDER